MKNKKKLFSAITIALLSVIMVFSLAACGGGGGNVSGNTFDVGNFSVLVPDGWKEFVSEDKFDEYDGDHDPNTVTIVKGGEDEYDLFTCPAVTITYYPDGSGVTDKNELKKLYDDVEDIDTIKGGSLTWEGFTAKSMESPIVMLWTTGGEEYWASVFLQGEEDSISMDDEEVLGILDSLETGK